MGYLLLIAVIVVYIILGILYESFIHPLTILSGLPSAAVGALLTLYIVGLPLTLYAFVGMIMLIGIVKKNAIMMIDFALQKRRGDASVTPEQAIYEAALIRFRPIMMTTMAAMMGTLPIALGTGMGAEFAPAPGSLRGRRPVAVPVADALHHAGDLRLSRPLEHAHVAVAWRACGYPRAGRMTVGLRPSVVSHITSTSRGAAPQVTTSRKGRCRDA